MRRAGYRTRLFFILAAFAVIPAVALMGIFGGVVLWALPQLSGLAAWESVAESGRQVIDIAEGQSLSPDEARAVAAHREELNRSLTQAQRLDFLLGRAPAPLLAFALLGMIVIGVITSRVAGHLSRQLSRPLQEIVGWTALIADGEPLPTVPPQRGAPEFEVLRRRMRLMAHELEAARSQELEAERLRTFRESARQVAHELKNPLTPIRFAVQKLEREAPPGLAETIEVLATESRRLETMARSFAQFGRLPEGPEADIDIAELVGYAARSTVPPSVPLEIDIESGLPMVRGHHDALARALSNVLINAVDACAAAGGRDGGIRVRIAGATLHGEPAVEIAVEDRGCGMSPAQLERIWEPYVTYKSGGTGLGLAIARQTVLAQRGVVHAASEQGEGTRIRFVLPVAGSGNGE